MRVLRLGLNFSEMHIERRLGYILKRGIQCCVNAQATFTQLILAQNAAQLAHHRIHGVIFLHGEPPAWIKDNGDFLGSVRLFLWDNFQFH